MINCWKKCVLVLGLILLAGEVCSQKLFTGRLLSKADSMPIPFAIVKLTDTGILTASNDSGMFEFIIPDSLNTLTIEVSALNCRQAMAFTRTGKQIENVFVTVLLHNLPLIEIVGLSASEIVKKAIARIRDNYRHSDHSVPVFYRQYHKKDSKYVFLVEAHADVLNRFVHYNKKTTTQFAAQIHTTRRSFNYEDNEQPHLDHFFDLMEENPVYEQRGSVLNPSSVDLVQYSFADQNNELTHIIHFYSAAAYDDRIVKGTMSVDKKSYAIVSIDVGYVRKPSYRSENNVTADYKYRVQLVRGSLHAAYEKTNNKWQNKYLLRSYTYDYSDKNSFLRAYTLTENFEMYFGEAVMDHPSDARYIKASRLYTMKYKYEPKLWEINVPDYYFDNAPKVCDDLSNQKTLDFQFEGAGK